MSQRIRDEFGNEWLVPGGRPPSRLINALSRQSYTDIVLPAVTLATGKPATAAIIPADPLLRVRLLECWEVLYGTVTK